MFDAATAAALGNMTFDEYPSNSSTISSQTGGFTYVVTDPTKTSTYGWTFFASTANRVDLASGDSVNEPNNSSFRFIFATAAPTYFGIKSSDSNEFKLSSIDLGVRPSSNMQGVEVTAIGLKNGSQVGASVSVTLATGVLSGTML